MATLIDRQPGEGRDRSESGEVHPRHRLLPDRPAVDHDHEVEPPSISCADAHIEERIVLHVRSLCSHGRGSSGQTDAADVAGVRELLKSIEPNIATPSMRDTTPSN